jgi:glyoxylase I family protein
VNIEHVALNVADPIAMAGWYTQHLGMRVVRKVDGPPHTHFIADESGRVVLELYRQTAPVPDYRSMHPMVVHIAFTAPDIAAERARLLASGAIADGEIATTPTGDRLAFLRDPWGVTVQLVQRAKPLLVDL